MLVGLIAAIAIGAFSVPFHLSLELSGTPTHWLMLYGMAMYALWTFYSVPQVVKGLGIRPAQRGSRHPDRAGN